MPDGTTPRSDENDDGFYRYCQAGMVYINALEISDSVGEIQIIGNPITTILDNTFSYKKQCVLLSLAYNQIHSLRPLAFQEMYSLKKLYLNHNLLTKLPDGIFEEINAQNPTLTHLYMQHNRLTTLRDGLFSPVISLVYVDLQGYPLMEIS